MCDAGQVPINVLPDDVLLEIFDFYVLQLETSWWRKDGWITLVHVCQKWRDVVFRSPRRLNLQLVCTARTPVKTLDIWPPLPVVIEQLFDSTRDMDNVLAALEHNDRICKITFWALPSAQEKALAAMQEPFPALTYLDLRSSGGTPPITPNPVLGGSAPHLRVLTLDSISIRGLPKLLLSATDLVVLNLYSIPHSAYISPDTLVTCLSASSRLKFLDLGFKSPLSRPDRKHRRLPPTAHTALPALTTLVFKGASEYLEDIVARIDAPLLHCLDTTFFHQLIFDTPQLTHFVSRLPALKVAHNQAQARVVFSEGQFSVVFLRGLTGMFGMKVPCRHSDWQLSSLAQLCTSSFPQALIPTVEHLYLVDNRDFQPNWLDDTENSQWLEILCPFTALKNLYLSKGLAPCVAPSLKELVGGRDAESLPALQDLFLEELHPLGPIEGAIGEFVAARRLSISHWERDYPSWSFGPTEVYRWPVLSD